MMEFMDDIMSSMSGGSVTVNGKTINIPKGANVSVIKGVVMINGKPYTDEPEEGAPCSIEITITGKLVNLEVKGNNTTVNCGDISGDLKASGNVTAKNVGRSLNTQGRVECGSVGGSINTQGRVTCKDVTGSVHTMGRVDCGDVGGSINTMGKVSHR